MLKRFVLKNYKNFKEEIEINFADIGGYQFNTECVADGVLTKMLIYGRNATGKTNLGRAIMDIGFTVFDGPRFLRDGVFLNADSKEDVARFSYTFDFNHTELTYWYTRSSNQELKEEELFIKGTSVFRCDFANMEFDFANLGIVEAETANVEIYLQALKGGEDTVEQAELKLPFLRWLVGNVALKKDSVLLRLVDYVRRMGMGTVGNDLPHRQNSINRIFYESLENPRKLKDLEDFLNAMGIECKLVLKKLPDGQMELYFDHEKLVPFYENASSGTWALVDLYRKLIRKVEAPSLIYLDEYDAFYHYEMAENVIRFFKQKYPRCQMIMTTHNTNLMTNRLMRPDCMFILSRTGTLTALCNATTRELREGHNLEKMYVSGEFEQYE